MNVNLLLTQVIDDEVPACLVDEFGIECFEGQPAEEGPVDDEDGTGGHLAQYRQPDQHLSTVLVGPVAGQQGEQQAGPQRGKVQVALITAHHLESCSMYVTRHPGLFVQKFIHPQVKRTFLQGFLGGQNRMSFSQNSVLLNIKSSKEDVTFLIGCS